MGNVLALEFCFMMLLTIVQNFTGTAGILNDANHLLEALTKASFDMGFSYFALSQHVDTGRCLAPDLRLHNYPERWAEFYDRNQFFRSDPIHRASQLTNMGFEWSAIPGMLTLTKQDHEVLARARAHGLATGYTIPAHIPGAITGSCSFVAPGHQRPALEQLCTAQLIGGLAFAAAQHLVDAELPDRFGRSALTDRQVDCVLWAAKGKTDWEIACILGISHETVIQYLKLARERYGVRRRAQLVVRALFEGLISFDDILKR